MQSAPQDYLPATLTAAIQTIRAFGKNVIKITPQKTTANPGDTTEFMIPNKRILDFSSFAIHKTITIGGEDTTAVPMSECFIESLRTEASTQAIEFIPHYNQLFQMMTNATMSTQCMKTASCYSLAPKPTYVLTAIGANDTADEIAVTTTTSTVDAKIVQRMIPPVLVQGPHKSVISHWIGWFGSLSNPIIDTSILPEVKTYITWAPNAIMASGTPSATYSLSGLYATMTEYVYPLYAEGLMMQLKHGIPVEYIYDRYQVNTVTTTAGSDVSFQWSVAARAVRKIWWTWQLATYSTMGDAVAGGHTTKYFIHSSGGSAVANTGITQAQLLLDGSPFPTHPITEMNTRYGYFNAIREMGVQGINSFDNSVESHNDWLKRKFFQVHSLDASMFADKSIVSGYDTEESQSNFTLNHADPTTAAGRTLIFAQFVARASVHGGRLMVVNI
jgi:hypothetical protein